MKWLAIILFILITEPSDSLKVVKDTSEVKLQMIEVQQTQMNRQLDTLWKILKIDTTLRKK